MAAVSILPRFRRSMRRAAHRAGVLAARSWSAFVSWFTGLGLSEDSILLAFAVAIGLAGALGVIAFYELIDLAHDILYVHMAGALSRWQVPLYRPMLTAAGIAAAAWLVRRLEPVTERSSSVQLIPTIQVAVARMGGVIRIRTATARILGSVLTLGSGGSAGSEGPVAVVGATSGSVLGRAFRFDPSRVRVLTAAGAAAGIAAAFNAPLAAAFFGLESILGSFTAAAFPPVVLASVVAAMISRSVYGDSPAIVLPMEYGYELNLEVFVFYPLLGVVAGLATVLFVRTFFGTESLLRKMRPPRALVPWLGGALVGVMVLLSGGVLVGYGHLQLRLDLFNQLAWPALALLAVGHIVATSITLNSGGSGGVFAPSLYVGAATGAAFGVALDALFPGLGLRPEPYALVGMGAVFAAATDAPIAALLIVFELTGDYPIVVPLMVAVVISHHVAKWIEPDSLYSGWLRRRGENLEGGADVDVLGRLTVADAVEEDPQVIGEAATVAQLLEHLGDATRTEYPVVDADLKPVGMISITDLGRIARQSGDLGELVMASDIANPTETIDPDASLREAIRAMGVRGTHALPVVDPGTGKLLGVVTRGGILGLYEREVAGEGS